MSQSAIQRPKNLLVGVLHVCKICGFGGYQYPWNPAGCPLCGARMNPVIEKHRFGPMFILFGGNRIHVYSFNESSGCPRSCMDGCKRVTGGPCQEWS